MQGQLMTSVRCWPVDSGGVSVLRSVVGGLLSGVWGVMVCTADETW